MDKILAALHEIGLPFAYDHFAEGESPDPPFICYLIPASDNFAADGVAYFKANEVHIELYTDEKDLEAESLVEAVLDSHGFFMTGRKYGSRVKASMKSCTHLKRRYRYGKQSQIQSEKCPCGRTVRIGRSW